MLIQPYNPDWVSRFEEIYGIIYPVIAAHILSIEHVGSTSVPGLAAKAIIDMDIVYEGSLEFPHVRTGLESLGYFHNGDQGIPKREAFKRAKNGKHPVLDHITHHLYACPKDSPELDRHLRFRNYLRSNPEACREYEAIKFRLAEEAEQDKGIYSEIKEEAARTFIEGILDKAK